MQYTFKLKKEAVWFVVVAMIVALLEILVRFDPAAVTDWKLWLVSLGAAAVRAGSGAAIAYFTLPESTPSTEPAPVQP